ncbi:hypothetical protein, partial [Bacillus cereus]|uniref:hypothetical protein n=1 Tax=Bacillus cereus TaxID=1396 RepID=UPI0022B6A40D
AVLLLIIASAAAIIVANSPLREVYETLLKYKTAGLSVEHWIKRCPDGRILYDGRAGNQA